MDSKSASNYKEHFCVVVVWKTPEAKRVHRIWPRTPEIRPHPYKPGRVSYGPAHFLGNKYSLEIELARVAAIAAAQVNPIERIISVYPYSVLLAQ